MESGSTSCRRKRETRGTSNAQDRGFARASVLQRSRGESVRDILYQFISWYREGAGSYNIRVEYCGRWYTFVIVEQTAVADVICLLK